MKSRWFNEAEVTRVNSAILVKLQTDMFFEITPKTDKWRMYSQMEAIMSVFTYAWLGAKRVGNI